MTAGEDDHDACRDALGPLRAALYDGTADDSRAALGALLAPDAVGRFFHPVETVAGAEAIHAAVWAPLHAALPDLERRDHIVMAGPEAGGDDPAPWVGCGGAYVGTFRRPWFGIPPTGQVLHVRFHEFYRFEGGRVVEIQALWDLPEAMMQAGVWPMGPSLGREWHVPGPATQDGVRPSAGTWGQPAFRARSADACRRVIDMLTALKRHPGDPDPASMEMARYWHPRMTWYGPSGIGTGRGYAGFRHVHQIPFLNAMPDRGRYVDEIDYHFFAEGDYVAVTGWPDMIQTLSDGGWLGIAPAGRRVEMRSLDFWRLEGDDRRIRENWVMVDLLHMWDQIGVDVLGRMQELAKFRGVHDAPDLDPWSAA
ncbi:polyketide cyclase [Rhodobacteraceae bacterium CCMM004]|nr:polyketide cyclase [Rhodobacteraceae bacterium CCMM004]